MKIKLTETSSIKLTWKNTLYSGNISIASRIDRDKVAKYCEELGFEYFCFNGDIYQINYDKKGKNYQHTSYKISDVK